MRTKNTAMWLRRWPLSARLLVLSALVTIIGFTAICATVMLDMRHGAEALARQSSENLAATLDSDIGRTVEVYDLSLRAVIAGLAVPAMAELSKEMRQLILFDNAASVLQHGAIQVFDTQGDVIIDATTLEPAKLNVWDDEFFMVHRSDGERGLFISRPMLHSGAYSVVLSRRITDGAGNFAGVVAGSIRVSYFHELFGRLRLNLNDNITVLRRDGVVIMRFPFDFDVLGRDLGKIPGLLRMLARADGSYSGIGAIDRIRRLYTWRDSGRPLLVLVGKSWADIASMWQTQASWIGGIVLALVGFIISVTLFSAREIGRRACAEDRLEELATTDALTGLRNRRKFDSAIDLEWRRAIRNAQPLAMLLIDADYFKIFNDSFGHQAGDQALIGIARSIAQSTNRAGDCAARYGGEEFAVLLPGISAEEALIVAENIRRRVEALPAEPAALTVSIGVASMEPLVTTEWSRLVEAADKALYAAKDAGRNQSVISSPSHFLLAA